MSTAILTTADIAAAGEPLAAPGPGAPAPAPARKIPWYMKLYGVLCLLQGGAVVILVALSLVTVFFLGGIDVLRTAWEQTDAANSYTSVMSVALYVASIVTSLVSSGVLVVFGVSLLRNRRRHAAQFAYALIALTVVELLLTIMLSGVSLASLASYLVQLVILVAISVTVDPALVEERRLQRALRDMELREDAEEGTLGRDETGRGYITLDFFNLFWTFMVCSVLGLLIEVAYHMLVVDPGVYQDRAGVLYGPFSPIYGFGAVLMTCALNRFYRANPAIIFLVSAVIGGAFEVFVSWFMQVGFGATAWDYTGATLFGLVADPIAVLCGGRTSTLFAAMWGVLGVAWIRFILPFMLRLINLIPWQWRYSVTSVVAALMLVNGLMTLQSLDCWYERASGVDPSTPVERFYAEHYDDEYMAKRFQSMTIDTSDSARLPEGATSLSA